MYGSSLIKTLLIALFLPIVGIAVSGIVLNDTAKAQGLKDPVPLLEQCVGGKPALASPGSAGKSVTCNKTVEHAAWLMLASIGSGAVMVLVLLVFWIAQALTFNSRALVATIIPPVIRISVFLVAINVFVQGAIITGAVYIGEIHWLGKYHTWVIGLFALTTLVYGFILIRSAFRFTQSLSTGVNGQVLDREKHPEIFKFVMDIANKLGAKPPNHIVAGITPTFFVTSCPVELYGTETRLKGETLYLSLPLLRIMTATELAAVVGHELGHFRGKDTKYSIKFAPVFAGLSNALMSMKGAQGNNYSPVEIPATTMLSYMLHMFHRKEANISRRREFLADEAGVEASSGMALATSLVKTSLYIGLWDQLIGLNINRLNRGKVALNLSEVFQDVVRYDIEHETLGEIMKDSLETEIAHPTDSHPKVADRLGRAGIDVDVITKEMLLAPKVSAVELVSNFTEIEKECTGIEHNMLVYYGFASPPEEFEPDSDYYFHQAIYSIAAFMVSADGKVDEREIDVAEGIGREMVSDFDPIDFREYCNNPELLPDLDELLDAMDDGLEEDGKQIVVNYLNAISESDDDIAPEETELLNKVMEKFGVQVKKEEEKKPDLPGPSEKISPEKVPAEKQSAGKEPGDSGSDDTPDDDDHGPLMSTKI